MKRLIMSSKLLSRILVICIRCIFFVAQFFITVKEKQIVFTSFSGRKFNDSPYEIFNELKNDKRFEDYALVWAFKRPDKRIPAELQVKMNTIEYYYTLLSSKYWIANSSIEQLIPINSKKHIYINTWHGVPLKILGNEQKKDSYLARNWYNSVKFDLLLSSGEYDNFLFHKIFPNTQNIQITGLPRNIKLYANKDEKERIKKETIKKLSLDPQKKTILYAPTFRADNVDDRTKMDLRINEKDLEKMVRDYNFLVRPHYFVKKIIPNKGFIDVRDYELNDLLICSDLLITDYSSVMFDYMILQKPIISFAYDLNEYREDNGTYMDPVDIGIPIIKESGKLIPLIEKELITNTVKTNAVNESFNIPQNNSIDIVKNFIEKARG